MQQLLQVANECFCAGGAPVFHWGAPASSPIAGTSGAAANGSGPAQGLFGTGAAPFSFGGASGLPSARRHLSSVPSDLLCAVSHLSYVLVTNRSCRFIQLLLNPSEA